MKRIGVKSLSVILFYLSWGNFIWADNRDALRFTISLEKRTYLVDEPIYLEMLATNISSREVAILPMLPNASWGHFRIVLQNQYGQPVDDHSGELLMYGEADWPGLIMMPGENWLLIKDLLSIFGKWDATHQISLFLSPGTYTVQVIYDTNPKAYVGKDRDLEDKQTLYSNVLQFEMVEPIGPEKAAHEKLISAFVTFDKELKKPHQSILLFRELINQYPTSVYQSVAYFYLYAIYTQYSGFKVERQNLIEDALRRFPNSGLAYELLDYERNEEINSLAQTTTTTKPLIMKKLNIASTTSRASFYAQCLVDMQRIELRTAERMKQARGNR